MSTITGETPLFPASGPAGSALSRHQSNSWSAPFSRLWQIFNAWAERRGQRHALAELVTLPHLLDDIGLTRAQALRGAKKPFWRR